MSLPGRLTWGEVLGARRHKAGRLRDGRHLGPNGGQVAAWTQPAAMGSVQEHKKEPEGWALVLRAWDCLREAGRCSGSGHRRAPATFVFKTLLSEARAVTPKSVNCKTFIPETFSNPSNGSSK